MQSLISTLIDTGAPWGLLCAVLMYAVIILWKKCNKLTDRLLSLSEMSIKKDERIHPVLKELVGGFDVIKRDIEELRRNKNDN